MYERSEKTMGQVANDAWKSMFQVENPEGCFNEEYFKLAWEKVAEAVMEESIIRTMLNTDFEE